MSFLTHSTALAANSADAPRTIGAAAAHPRQSQKSQYLGEYAGVTDTAAISLEPLLPSTTCCAATHHQSPLAVAILAPSASSVSHAASNTI